MNVVWCRLVYLGWISELETGVYFVPAKPYFGCVLCVHCIIHLGLMTVTRMLYNYSEYILLQFTEYQEQGK